MTTSITTLVLCGGTVKPRFDNSDSTSSKFFPVGQRHQFVWDFLQPLKSSVMIPCPCCTVYLFAAPHISAVRFANLNYLSTATFRC
jgi:hypothetical protein